MHNWPAVFCLSAFLRNPEELEIANYKYLRFTGTTRGYHVGTLYVAFYDAGRTVLLLRVVLSRVVSAIRLAPLSNISPTLSSLKYAFVPLQPTIMVAGTPG